MCVCLSHRQSEVRARAMGALRNMLGSLPGGVAMCGALPGGVAMCGALPGGVALCGALPGGVAMCGALPGGVALCGALSGGVGPCGEVRTAATMWRTVMDLVVTGGVAMCGDVTGLLLVLVEMMKDIELQQVQLFLSVPSFIPPLEQQTYIHESTCA